MLLICDNINRRVKGDDMQHGITALQDITQSSGDLDTDHCIMTQQL